jgi:hypothetical protein
MSHCCSQMTVLAIAMKQRTIGCLADWTSWHAHVPLPSAAKRIRRQVVSRPATSMCTGRMLSTRASADPGRRPISVVFSRSGGARYPLLCALADGCINGWMVPYAHPAKTHARDNNSMLRKDFGTAALDERALVELDGRWLCA